MFLNSFLEHILPLLPVFNAILERSWLGTWPGNSFYFPFQPSINPFLRSLSPALTIYPNNPATIAK